jgi:hypothetical protein
MHAALKGQISQMECFGAFNCDNGLYALIWKLEEVELT